MHIEAEVVHEKLICDVTGFEMFKKFPMRSFKHSASLIQR